jgi:ribonuclease HI
MLYTIYTDASCLKNPNGPGGYAAVIFREGEISEELSGGDAVTTNNRMELMAAVVGLRAVREPSVITLYSDGSVARIAGDLLQRARQFRSQITGDLP